MGTTSLGVGVVWVRREIANGTRETIVNVVMPSSSATVFQGAKKFNRDLSSWDVSRVTYMVLSKLCALHF